MMCFSEAWYKDTDTRSSSYTVIDRFICERMDRTVESGKWSRVSMILTNGAATM